MKNTTEFGVSCEDKSLGASGFTQLKPEAGRSMVVGFIGKMKASFYHWLRAQKKGYGCNGDTCPACKAGVTQSWGAVALAIGATHRVWLERARAMARRAGGEKQNG